MFPVLTLLLVGSGFAALVYQVLWVRLLGLVFGVTVYAASTVLAAFMGGLALGSYLAGRVADETRRPLQWLAAAELLIAVFGLATPLLLASLTTIYGAVSSGVQDNPAALTVARFVGSALVLLVPTTMMGATMPFALRSAIARETEVARRTAILYAANTGGALAGALAAGYALIPTVGVTRTLQIAAGLNVLVAVLALLLARRERADLPASPDLSSTDTAPHAEPGVAPQAQRVVLWVFGISGFVSLALEVVWIRALLMFLPATTYVFTTILAVVLGGIAAGSALASAIRRSAATLRVLAAIEAALALAVLLSFAALGWTYGAGWKTTASLQASALAILPAAILMGLAFPLALHCWAQGTSRIGARVGSFFAVNVAGGVAGALVGGFLLIPAFGLRASFLVLTALTMVCAIWLLAAGTRWSRRALWARGTALVAMYAAAAYLVPDPLGAALSRRYPGDRILWRRDGVQSSVSVHLNREGRRILYMNGLHQADDTPGMLTFHRLIGTLAMALHADPRDALVVGLGGGATASGAARFTDARITIVELADGVVGAAEWFRQATGDVLARPNVRLRIGDGRNYLLLGRDRFDVITADIIHPTHAGAGNLYSAEYFRLARHALRPDGLMLQWIGHRAVSEYKLIARTFLSVFPHATVWADGNLLVGTVEPFRLVSSRYRERLADPTFTRALGSVGIAGFRGLVRTYTAGPDELRAFVGDGPILTDDRPLVEYFLSLPPDEPLIDLTALRGDVNRHIVP